MMERVPGWASCLIHLCLRFFLRKISPELTSAANPPLFAEEDWPWANIHTHLLLLYMWDACHSMAWQVVCKSTPRIWIGKPQAAEVECAHLTAEPLGWPLTISWRNSSHFVYVLKFALLYKLQLNSVSYGWCCIHIFFNEWMYKWIHEIIRQPGNGGYINICC